MVTQNQFHTVLPIPYRQRSGITQ